MEGKVRDRGVFGLRRLLLPRADSLALPKKGSILPPFLPVDFADDKERMRAIMKTRKEYQSVDISTVNLINSYTAVRISTDEANGGKVNMGNAFQELIEDGRKEGRTEGRAEGRKEIADEIKKLRASGMPADQILQKIEQSVNRKARTRKKGS